MQTRPGRLTPPQIQADVSPHPRSNQTSHSTPDPIRRLTPPQIQALHYLRDGWQYQTVGKTPPTFHRMLLYYFRQGTRSAYVAGSTLASLERRGWLTWEATDVALAHDGTTMRGYTLILTDAGRRILP